MSDGNGAADDVGGDDDEAASWLPLRRTPVVPPFSRATVSLILSQLMIIWIFTAIIFQWTPLWVRVMVLLGVVVLTFAAVPVIGRLRHPQVAVNLADGRIRAGRRTVAFEDLSTAHILVASTPKKRTISLLLEDGAGLRAAVNLRDQDEQPLSDSESRVLLEIIERSDIRMPVAREDPQGRFGRFNFPTNLTKADAIALVTNPPRFADPLPIPPAV